MNMYSYQPKKNRGGLKTLLTVVITAVVTVVIMKYVPNFTNNNNKNNTNNETKRLGAEVENLRTETSTTVQREVPTLIEEIMPSVVGIGILKPDGLSIFDTDTSNKWGLGTGIIVSNKGYILTNQHLANKKNTKVIVTLYDGKTVEGKVIWTESNIDLAIVKVDNENLKGVKLGDSSGTKVGENVLAIGNPLGLEFQRTVTSGIISGVDRTLRIEENNQTTFMEDLLQTDASINPGNSGGPLINSAGEVIGVNTVKVTSAEGIGFAVPINIVKPIIEKLEANGDFTEAYLGIYAHDKEVIPYMDSKIDMDKGIYVVSVDSIGPCGRGLAVGDIITAIDGVEINKMVDLRAEIYKKEPGDKISLTILSNRKEKNINVTLGTKKTTTLLK
jgi:S1-C subfamily serine protease